MKQFSLEWKGRRCRIAGRGALGLVAITLDDGETVVVERDELRKAPAAQAASHNETADKIIELARGIGWDEDDLLYAGWEAELIPHVQSVGDLSAIQTSALLELLGPQAPVQ
jgi:hypothetical protein